MVSKRLREFLGTPIARSACRFGISGATVTGLHVIVAASLIETIMPHAAVANGIAFVICTFTSYLINTYWSFSHRPGAANFARFITVACIGLSLTILISGTAERLGLSYWIGIAAVAFVVPPTTFLMHNFWTFR